MKIGVFDSGLGGLMIMRSIRDRLPNHDLVYLGDTLRLPYGGRSRKAIYHFTESAIDHLFKVEDCALVIVACNTASANALRQIQQDYLINNYPDRRVLGVVVPTLETAIEHDNTRIGLIGTNYTISSGIYEEELKKLNSRIELFTQATPLLVPLIENDGLKWAPSILKEYLAPLRQKDIQSLILGCTHYPILKEHICKELGRSIKLIAQDEIVPNKLARYLDCHPEINEQIDKNSHNKFLVTDLPEPITNSANELWSNHIRLEKVKLN